MLLETPAGAVTANSRILRQSRRNRKAFDRPQMEGPQGALDFAAAALAPVPIAGDLAGFASDVGQMYANPDQRTWQNIGLTAAGVLPFVPRLKPQAPTAQAPTQDAAALRRNESADNVFSSLSDMTLHALRKSAREAAARSNDEAAIFRLNRINAELERRGVR
jgi:hypothetical protein